MNCVNHADAAAVAYCRTCGKPLCSACARDVRGVVYCEECLASHVAAAVTPAGAPAVLPGTQPGADAPNPRLAALLGFIPGVGAMYNGEFAKGFIHVLVFATLIWMSDHFQGSVDVVFGFAIAAFVFYMPIEAYKTARARQLGLPAPDPFGFNNLFASGPVPGRTSPGAPASAPPPSSPPGVASSEPASAAGAVPVAEPRKDEPRSPVPVGALILIGLGVLFLLDEMGALHFDWIWRFWPLILIAIGVRILLQRQRRGW